MPDIDGTCNNKATITLGPHTEAEVECEEEANHEDKHVASNVYDAVDPKTGKASRAHVIFVW